jgi:putative hydrolase of the HAD superfamily
LVRRLGLLDSGVMTVGRRIEAVVFDLFYTLVHPGTYPGGTGRIGWLAWILGVDPTDLEARWVDFEPVLESGQTPKHSDGLGPELRWVRAVAADLGVVVTGTDLDRIEADWDLTRRRALLGPPHSAVATLVALREHGIRLGVLSNTHGLEMRAWGRSPLAAHVEVVALSHEIGACKPDPATYAYVLSRLEVSAAAAAYVGDGSSDELVGARAAGFGMVVLAEETPAKVTPAELPRLRAQADASVKALPDVLGLVDAHHMPSRGSG